MRPQRCGAQERDTPEGKGTGVPRSWCKLLQKEDGIERSQKKKEERYKGVQKERVKERKGRED